MTKVRILDISGIYPSSASDFEGRSVAALDRALVRQGLSVTTLVLRPWVPLWVAQHRDRLLHLAVKPMRFSDQGVDVSFARYPHAPRLPLLPESSRVTWNGLSAARRASTLSDRSGARFEIIHAQGIYSALAAEHLARTRNVPLAVTLRDDLGHLSGSTLQDPIYRELLRRTAVLFAIGPAQMRDLRELIPEENHIRLHLAPNGVELERIRGVVDRLPTAHKRSSDPTSIVSVSTLYRLKGIHENLAALRRLLDSGITTWTYTVVGDGPYRHELEALTRTLGLSERVDFVGRVGHSEALRRIHESDVFCLPSWMESFGNVYAEAAVCGVPAIGCLGQGPELLIRDGETGILVPPRDEVALADALTRLICQPRLAKGMGAAATLHIKRFTWDRTAGIYVQALDQLGARQPRGRRIDR